MRDLEPGELIRRVTTVARRTSPGAVVDGLRRLEGGVSSLTYAATLTDALGDRPIVLKVAPPGLAPVRNRNVLRQARVLGGLADLPGFPVPAVLFQDVGEPPEVPPLFAMELCPGDSYEPMLDVSDSPPAPDVAGERMRVAARALARLHTVAPRTLGLGDEPVSPVREELDRWARLFATVDPDIGVGHEKLHARLAQRVPEDIAAQLLHGDYRVANMLFTGPKLEAVIDWEIWSVGDPRSDLAWLLM
ncbi:MAG: phosphotransferase family protein, partial [Sciscionella sp.]